MATLAAAIADHRRLVPLEGQDPEELFDSVQAAMNANLVEDLDWISPPAAIAALYQLASALPQSEIKRALGRRVFARLRQGDAETFISVATQLVLESRKALSTASLRARVALSLDLPIGLEARADGLALALISRKESSREWLSLPSTGSLPSRRLAARLLERAAWEAASRASEGDESGVRVFETSTVQAAWTRLLADRESLVWRHVATARGLLATSCCEFHEEIERHLDANQGITEWRRAAVSLVASIAFEPSHVKRCYRLLRSEVLQRDHGIAAAMIYGLPRAVQREPEITEELLEQLVQHGGLDAAEALVDFRRERLGGEYWGQLAFEQAIAKQNEALKTCGQNDDGQRALALAVIEELKCGLNECTTLQDSMNHALNSFVQYGTQRATEEASRVLQAAEERLCVLERYYEDRNSEDRVRAFRVLRELDRALLESDTLANLLILSSRGDDAVADVRPLGNLFQRMTQWLVVHEGDPLVRPEVDHFTLRVRRLRSMLHLIDADGYQVDDRKDILRQRRLLTTQILFRRVRDDVLSPLRRAVNASAARACDALVREELCEISDVVVAVGLFAQTTDDIIAMAEASMVPDIETSLLAYAQLERAIQVPHTQLWSLETALQALFQLANDLPVAASPRVEALRVAVLDLAQALQPLVIANSLSELQELSAPESPLAKTELAIQVLVQLVRGARRRLGLAVPSTHSEVGSAIRFVDIFVERALTGGLLAVHDALDAAREVLRDELPRALAEVTMMVLERLKGLPLDAPRAKRLIQRPATSKGVSLPGWMPSNRTLGGFFVIRSIGAGAVGTVFVARRSDARHDTKAQEFALKVPEYGGSAARTLSEEQFLQLFREEAGALLALPQHPNIARFVTFDAGARPKPILVMELVKGPNLERVLEVQDMNMSVALNVLEGVACGLEEMHKKGIAHLDLKPGNVILRQAKDTQQRIPVLVDFGLAGRNLRPGCATANYGAPEIWGHDESKKGNAIPADVYAFGCLVFELLTGKPLFEAKGHDLAIITAHLQHDGLPPGVETLQKKSHANSLAELLQQALRRNPDHRGTVSELRVGLGKLHSHLKKLEWPICLS